jgi:catechol 2,3-dioxygenase-like lactoylglutathione lyase family enzyme
MSAAEVHHNSRDAAAGTVDMHLEVQIIPVSDADRSRQFYQRLGWRLDGDVAPLDGLRIVQFTPPGSAASVTFGQGITAAAPGSAEGGLIVSDIEAARGGLAGRGRRTRVGLGRNRDQAFAWHPARRHRGARGPRSGHRRAVPGHEQAVARSPGYPPLPGLVGEDR